MTSAGSERQAFGEGLTHTNKIIIRAIAKRNAKHEFESYVHCDSPQEQ